MAARYDGPDHWAPMTWPRCVVDGCTERIDPWRHRTRCDVHQAERDAKLDRVRAIVAVNREAELTPMFVVPASFVVVAADEHGAYPVPGR